MNVSRRIRETITSHDSSREELNLLAAVLANGLTPLKLVSADGREVELPESLVRVLTDAVEALAEDGAVSVIGVDRELTPQQAARVLNVSRPYLIRLMDAGKIPFHRVGTHRRIRLADLLCYKNVRDEQRREELRDLSRISRELGIPE